MGYNLPHPDSSFPRRRSAVRESQKPVCMAGCNAGRQPTKSSSRRKPGSTHARVVACLVLARAHAGQGHRAAIVDPGFRRDDDVFSTARATARRASWRRSFSRTAVRESGSPSVPCQNIKECKPAKLLIGFEKHMCLMPSFIQWSNSIVARNDS